jgi:uncharacterized membrane protein YdjX (TVP38/TMEM64 family)
MSRGIGGAPSTGRVRQLLAWGVLALLLLASILVPFAFWEEPIARMAGELLDAEGGSATLAGTLTILLVLDVLLPVPSSVVSTAAGARFGIAGGIAISWVGLTGGCILAAGLGRKLGRPFAEWLVGERALLRAGETARRWGAGALVLCRAVPVLAEASVLLAGVTSMPWKRFLAVTSLANLGIAAIYAWVGQKAMDSGAFLLAFGGAVGVPAIALWLWSRVVTRRPRQRGRGPGSRPEAAA